MIDSGSENTALATAQTLAFDDIEQAMLGGTAKAPSDGNNREGSFEKLMQFGGRMGGSPT